MLKKIISCLTGCAMLCGSVIAPITASGANLNLSADVSIEDDQMYQGKKLPSPDKMPVNDCIKDLDPSVVKIMIDPGHFSYYNRSPVYSPYWESVMTWKLSNYLQKELTALGAHADLTKSSLDEDPTLNDRGFLSKGYDFFISVHSNAGAASYVDAPLALVYQDLPWTDIDDISKDMGKLLTAKVAEVMNTNQKGTIAQRKGTDDHDNNGVMDDEWYSVLFGSRYVGTPGILMEHSYHTNYRSTLWLYNDDNLKKLAKEEAAVIYKYFKEKKDREIPKTTTKKTTTTTTTTTKRTTTTLPPVVKLEIPEKMSFGDINGDEMVDASDASLILMEYAYQSTGRGTSFYEEMKKAADVNRDRVIDSTDASKILAFFAYISTGGTESDFSKWVIISQQPSTEPDTVIDSTSATEEEKSSSSSVTSSSETHTTVAPETTLPITT